MFSLGNCVSGYGAVDDLPEAINILEASENMSYQLRKVVYGHHG